MVTHGTLHSYVLERSAVAKEHFVFQGIPTYDELAEAAGVPWSWKHLVEDGVITSQLDWLNKQRFCRLSTSTAGIGLNEVRS